MNDNQLFVDIKLSKVKINQFVQLELDKMIIPSIQNDGFTIQLSKAKSLPMEINANQRSIFLAVPLTFHFLKSAGLFSVEGEGSILLNLESTIDIDEDLHLKTNTSLLNYEWINEPVIQLGQLNIPVETISNFIINHMKDKMLLKIDESVAQQVDLRGEIVQKIKEFGYNYPVYKKPDLYFNAQILQIQSSSFQNDDDGIFLKCWIEVMTKISDVLVQFAPNPSPKFFWTEKELVFKNSQRIELEISFQGLAKMLVTQINGKEFGGKVFDIESIHIRSTDLLEIKANLLEPIKGIITITALPELDRESNKIDLTDLNISIDASNFIYKLSSPIIEKLIKSWVQGELPFDPKPIFEQVLSKSPTISLWDNQIEMKPQVQQICIESLRFGQQEVVCTLLLEGAEVDIIM